MPCMLHYTLAIVIPMLFAPFVRLSAHRPTLCVLYLRKCGYPYKTCTNWDGLPIYGKFMMKQSLAEMHYINIVRAIGD